MRWSACKRLFSYLVASVMLVVFGCQPQETAKTAGGSQAGGARQTPTAAAAHTGENSECLICHMDFKNEELSVKHDQVGIGCINCHGDSLAHGDDELNITPPDKLYGRAEIVPFCKGCHSTHVEGKVYDDFLKAWHSKRRPNGRMILDDSVCTDCHGSHAVLRPDQQQFMGG
ncbi:MAG TPA: cytochrome c3 family protein [Sedimentisphaerales bacterium]|nr:cytochrome c3 family protein [Sedimentisphaerales bacterium]